MEFKKLYHGTPTKLEEDTLGTDRYTTSEREIAITSAILKCEGVGKIIMFTSKNSPPYAAMSGHPRQEYIFLYTFPPDRFSEI